MLLASISNNPDPLPEWIRIRVSHVMLAEQVLHPLFLGMSRQIFSKTSIKILSFVYINLNRSYHFHSIYGLILNNVVNCLFFCLFLFYFNYSYYFMKLDTYIFTSKQSPYLFKSWSWSFDSHILSIWRVFPVQ